MWVTQMEWCDFFVRSLRGHFLERLVLDHSYVEMLVDSASLFFQECSYLVWTKVGVISSLICMLNVRDKVIPCYKPVTVFAGADTAVADDDGHNVPSGSSLVKVPTVPVASAQAPPQLQCI